ncbi:hypothetical protein PG996_008101 [Apiospora saccharicola]|uniref:Uncharacterized protein n=1 Tax=Apiospora saccharicola TaxID=335842 RepID=A0ABR1UWY9_9PEZI
MTALIESGDRIAGPPFDPLPKELADACIDGINTAKGWTFEEFEAKVREGVGRDAQWYADKLGITDGSEEDEYIVAVVRELFCDVVAITPEEAARVPSPPDSPPEGEQGLGGSSSTVLDDAAVRVIDPALLRRYRMCLLLAAARGRMQMRMQRPRKES